MAEDEMVGGHHRLNGHEFEQTPGVGDGQGGLACCSPGGHKESDTMTELSCIVLFSFPFASILFTAFIRPSQTTILSFCISLSSGWS